MTTVIDPTTTTRDAQPVFLFASGLRCGSTLVQRTINSHPDAAIWGEHGGALAMVFDALDRILDWEKEHSGEREASAEVVFSPNATPPPERLWSGWASLVRVAFRGDQRIWGFKETRYDWRHSRILRGMFPSAKIIFITRDPFDVLRSLLQWEENDWWDREFTRIALNDYERVARSALTAQLSPLDLLIRYEDVVADFASFVGDLEQFLEVEDGALDRSVAKTRLHSPPGTVRRKLETAEVLESGLYTESIQEVAILAGYAPRS